MVFIVFLFIVVSDYLSNIFESLKEQEILWHDVLMIYPQMYVCDGYTNLYSINEISCSIQLDQCKLFGFQGRGYGRNTWTSSNGYWSADSVGKIGYRSSQCYGMDDLVDSYCICI